MRVHAWLCLATLSVVLLLVFAEVAEGKKEKDKKDKQPKDKKPAGGKDSNNGKGGKDSRPNGKGGKDSNGKGGKGKANGQKKGTTTAPLNVPPTGGSGDATQCRVAAQQLNSRGDLQCRDAESVIADLAFVGLRQTQNGACEGLTPQLFVETANCMWNRQCNLTYDDSDTNFMIKLHAGPESCVVLSPEHFHFNFSCAKASAIEDVMREEVSKNASQGGTQGGTAGEERTVSASSGLLRSHPHHPWHYSRHDSPARNVTLRRPPGAGSRLCYTFLKYHLSHHDTLAFGPLQFDHDKKPEVGKTQCLPEAEEVRVSLELPYLSHGAEGFLVCYSWQSQETASNVCSTLLTPEPCPLPKSVEETTTKKPGGNRKKPTKAPKTQKKAPN